jgi:hypothetical protein
MHTIHETPTFILEAAFTHDGKRDIHTLDFYQTWPTMAHPHRRRIAQLNLPRAALAHLAEVIADSAAASPETAGSGS